MRKIGRPVGDPTKEFVLAYIERINEQRKKAGFVSEEFLIALLIELIESDRTSHEQNPDFEGFLTGAHRPHYTEEEQQSY